MKPFFRLPVGSVVFLKNGTRPLVILGTGQLSEKPNQLPVFYDYVAGLSPQGMDMRQTYYFDHEDVERVLFEGYVNDSYQRYQEVCNRWLVEHSGEYTRQRDKPTLSVTDAPEA